MEEFTKSVVEEYLAYQRRVLKTLLDRGVYTQEGIEDHIRCLRESIEEDLDSNKAYALLKEDIAIDFYAWTFPQKRYQLVKIIS